VIKIDINKENTITVIIILAVLVIAFNLNSYSSDSISGNVVFNSLYKASEYYSSPKQTEIRLMDSIPGASESQKCPKFPAETQKPITVRTNERVRVCVYPKTPIGVENIIYLYDKVPAISQIGRGLKPSSLDTEKIASQGQFINKPFDAVINIDRSKTIQRIKAGETLFYIGVIDKSVNAITYQPITIIE
jgi:hypothetical protein